MDAVCKWCIILMRNKTVYYLHESNTHPPLLPNAFMWTKDREQALRFDNTTAAREFRIIRLKERKDVFVKQLIY